MSAIIEILATSIVSTALLAALAYFLKATIGEWLTGSVRQHYAKDLEAYKTSLKNSGEVALERLKSQLHADAAIANIRHATQYEKAADVIVGVHKRLDDAFNAVAAYTSILETPAMGTKARRREKVNTAINSLRDYFRENRIYLPRALALKVKDIESQLFDTANKFSMHVEFPRNEERSTSEWTATYNRLKDTIRPLLDALEEHFRGMLGINAMFSDIVAEQSGEPEQPMAPSPKS